MTGEDIRMFRDLEIWLNHFEYHAQHPRQVPAGLSDVLKPEERRLIERSLAVFQLGEQCDGKSLLRVICRYAQTHKTKALVRIIELFIKEQQRHAALLHLFMEDHGLRAKRTDWTDFVFCCLRHIGGFEYRLHLFVTAELIASVYYRALEVATGCQRLKVLCRTLVADELAHIGLQSQLLLTLRANKSAPARVASRLLHRAFFAATAVVVYATHRRVLRAAGYHLESFLRACSSQYDFYLEPPRTCRESSPKPLPRA
jgi:hypothetical protein